MLTPVLGPKVAGEPERKTAFLDTCNTLFGGDRMRWPCPTRMRGKEGERSGGMGERWRERNIITYRGREGGGKEEGGRESEICKRIRVTNCAFVLSVIFYLIVLKYWTALSAGRHCAPFVRSSSLVRKYFYWKSAFH